MGNKIGELVFKEFKETIGKSFLIIKSSDIKEKEQYGEALSIIKEKGYIDYSIGLSNIQISLTTSGKIQVQNCEDWES